MGRFDEQATYEKERAAESGGVGDSTAPTAQMSDMSVNEQQVSGGVFWNYLNCRFAYVKLSCWRTLACADAWLQLWVVGAASKLATGSLIPEHWSLSV